MPRVFANICTKLGLLAVFLIAATIVVAWLCYRRATKQRAEEKAQEKARLDAEAETKRLAEERRLTEEKLNAEIKVREEARLAAEVEKQAQKETEEKAKFAAETESKRLAEEIARAKAEEDEKARLAAEIKAREKARLETEAKRLAEENARAEAQARERSRLKAEADASEKARLDAVAKRLAEELRQAKEKAEADAREKLRLVAEAETLRLAKEKVKIEEIDSEPPIDIPPQQTPSEKNEALHPPTYRPTSPVTPSTPLRPPSPTKPRPATNMNADLHLRVQIIFGRGGVVKHLALVPDHRDGMPGEIEVKGTQGELRLTELGEDYYEPIVLEDASDALLKGIEWHGRGDARRLRWILGGREIYVFAPGDEFGLPGFISTARLWLNTRQIVLATACLLGAVLAALSEAGCATPEVSDDTIPGVPPGWLVFRDVKPTRFVQRGEQDIMNVLCPAHDITPHFAGGIRLERNTWLAGFPPRIRFTGEFVDGFQVMIDNQPAHPSGDGGFESSGWDSEGEHRLWFGDRAETYSLCTMSESWEQWLSHDFGTGVSICGASTQPLDGVQKRQVRVPTSNPILVGARPGEIFCCPLRDDIRCKTHLAMVPFTPIWALPFDPAHADKNLASVLLFNPNEPQADAQNPVGKRTFNRKLAAWVSVIRDSGRKGLGVSPDNEQAKALWRKYRAVAKRVWRKMR